MRAVPIDRRCALAAAIAAVLAVQAPPARAADAPGAPGAVATWTEGDKDGLGTPTAPAGHALFTLDDGELTEVYAPDLGTPSVRDLQLVVTDGRTFAEREREDASHARRLRVADRPSVPALRVARSRPLQRRRRRPRAVGRAHARRQ